MAILEAHGIKKRFGGVTALVNGEIKCEKGRITGLLGMNGSGKSTISKIIAGIYGADGGEIIYDGKPVKFRNPDDAKKHGIAMVFQNLSLIQNLTVWQNVVLGIEKSRGLFLDNKSAKEIAKGLFDQLLPGLDLDKRVYQLTPVEMQVVEIAKAVAEEPRVLILDEPTASLEKEQVESLFAYMRKLAKRGIGMVFTSHRMWEVLEICDDVIVFKNGATAGSIDFRKDEKDLDKIITMITGESCGAGAVKEQREIPEDYIFTVEGLKYGNLLKSIDIKLKKGEILGIGGLTGQGQHELMLALAGNYRKANCRTRLDGKEVKLNKPRNAIRSGIMLVPGDRQTEGLFLKHSIFMNMVFPKLSLRKQPIVTPAKRYKTECKEVSKTLSIVAKDLLSPVDTLSGGNQQKVVVGKWLSFDTKVLLLSDPAKGVDVGAKRDLYAFISKLVKEKDMGVILYASDSEELLENCDRVLIMYEGRIACELAGDRLNSDEIVTASMSLK